MHVPSMILAEPVTSIFQTVNRLMELGLLPRSLPWANRFDCCTQTLCM